MEQHAVPRQITTFEFKLVGFLTLKQFLYLAMFAGLAVVVFFIFPIPILNVILAFITAGGGAAFAFIPINERPLDVWVSNFFHKLYSPSQYYYHKKNSPPDFLQGIYISTPAQIVANHIDANQKLSSYMQNRKDTTTPPNKPQIHTMLNQQQTTAAPVIPVAQTPTEQPVVVVQTIPMVEQPHIQEPQAPQPINFVDKKKPFLFGTVKNTKQLALANMLIYIKDSNNSVVRLLKSNLNGIFATFHSFNPGVYEVEIKDTSQKYFFDTMKITVENENNQPISIISKELI